MPTRSITLMLMLPAFFMSGRWSVVGISMMSTSPLMRAWVAVLASGITTHSTRSTLASFAPANPSVASERGL